MLPAALPDMEARVAAQGQRSCCTLVNSPGLTIRVCEEVVSLSDCLQQDHDTRSVNTMTVNTVTADLYSTRSQ